MATTTINRQNALFSAEQWTRLYEALSSVSFNAYSQDTLRAALIDYVRLNYPEEFNDWIGSSEFVIKIDILTWLSQNLAWRVDLNTRENMLQLAERRESLLQLAHNIAYSASRVRAASGELKIVKIKTTQQLEDPDGLSIDQVIWNDSTDPDWLEKWTTVMNSVFSSRTPFGKPLAKFTKDGTMVATYRLNSLMPSGGVYGFSAAAGGQSMRFEIYSPEIDPTTGYYREFAPNPTSPFSILYRSNGLGYSSAGTGFFLPIKQGTLNYTDVVMDGTSSAAVDVSFANINDQDVFVTRVNDTGQILEEWQEVDSSYGQSVGFNALTVRKVFDVLTRPDDKITVRFGDGKYGDIPVGNFRIWYRTSSAVPKIVKTNDIRDRQISIPYASGGRIYTLTVWLSLADDMTDAAASESNADIRYRANKVYYAQDRMVNNEDYNSYFLKETSILKVLAVNRTYSGQGSSIPVNDPTGTYSNVRVIGEDGRIYKSFVKDETVVISDPEDYSPTDILDDIVQASLSEADKSTLYHNEYPELALKEYTWFKVDENVNAMSRGRFMRDESSPYATPVGSDAESTDPLRLLGANSIFRLTDFRGKPVRIDYVAGNGTSTSGIVMKDLIEDGTRVYSAFPAFRQVLNDAERAAILQPLELRKSFALRWNQETLAWVVIIPEDIDTTSEFSLENAGDTTEAGLDASWVFRGEYRPLTNDQDRWVFYDRGLEIRFESDRDVDFFHANGEVVVDAATGRAVRDSVKLLRDNESRDSLPRRGLSAKFGSDPNQGAIQLAPDGTKTVFDLMAEVVNEEHVFVSKNNLLLPQTDWTILHVPGTDKISFDTAPATTDVVSVRYEPHKKYLSTRYRTYTGNDVTRAYSLGSIGLYTDNVFVFVGGVRLRPGEDFHVYRTAALEDVVSLVIPPSNGAIVKIFALYGSGPAFGYTMYTGTGSVSSYASNAIGGAWPFVNGQYVHGATLSTADPNNYAVVMGSPPALNAEVDIVAGLYPDNSLIWEMNVTATANQDSLEITSLGATGVDAAERLLVWVNGLMSGWSYEDGFVFFDNPLSAGTKVTVVYFAMVAAPEGGFSVINDMSYPTQPTYIGSEVAWWIESQLTHDDGYTNPNGVVITNVDVDVGGDADNPFLFRELVIQDGTDLALWRRKTVLGAEEWDPVSESTSPKATYDNYLHQYLAGDPKPADRAHGDIHFTGDVWLLADSDLDAWVLAPDQTAYRYEIGRSGLRFQWNHYAADGGRIDPSVSNIIDVYALTSGYDIAVRDWARLNRPIDEFPVPETTDALSTAYSDFETKRMISDSIVWHPVAYKPLFGPRASSELRAKFIVVASTAGVSDSDVKTRILRLIDEYFDYRLWDFGSTFYFSELAAYIHRKLPTLVQSVVIVPRSGTGNFGRLYQVRAEPDELFLSVATVDDIEIASSLVDSDMKIT